jgi:very-short-patch-repair endonuclease
MEKYFSRYKDTPKYITRLAREFRITPTPQEEILWSKISGGKLNGMKFRRQFAIGRYIVDFYNHTNRLVIEIDGGIHNDKKEYDSNRDAYMHAGGYNVLRFKNSDVDYHIDAVIQKILEHVIIPLKATLRPRCASPRRRDLRNGIGCLLQQAHPAGGRVAGGVVKQAEDAIS